ncbi:MAG: hypothetical protein ABEL76_09530 [Bradymonadaceae bacterium]
MRSSTRFLALTLFTLLGSTACQTDTSGGAPDTATSAPDETPPQPGEIATLPPEPEASASSAFWDHWGDGRAELSSYTGKVSRYGELREARAVLVYVTEPHDRRRWIKDDDVADEHRVEVLKLNRSIKFQTGVYPYSVLISTFSPVADWGREHRFQPTKISMTAQEWCGQVFHALWPGPARMLNALHSYFASEGDRRRVEEIPKGALFEDALFVQLRELDGDFAGGSDWEGKLVPGLWQRRKRHGSTDPVSASIRREEVKWQGTPVTRFHVSADDRSLIIDVERAEPHRILHWKRSDGTEFHHRKTERLPYWKLNRPGDESKRRSFGLPPTHLNMRSEDDGDSKPR